MLTLLSERFAPITSQLGFLEVPLAVASDGLLGWRRRLHFRVSRVELTGQLSELLSRLPPMTGGVRPRELLVGTEGDQWTAYFDCGIQGTDAVSTIGFLAQELRCQGLALMTIPHTRGTGLEEPGRYGGVQFELFGPEDRDFLNYVRTVSVTFDTSWRFDVSGEVQPFELVERYGARKKRDRLTSEMVAGYAAALGVRPFDESSYDTRGVLIQSALRVPAGGLELNLEEAQARNGIVPGVADRIKG
jgi:hypothetical protein